MLKSINLKIAVFVIGFVFGLVLGLYNPKHEYEYIEITVQPNDTLWELTSRNSTNEYNIQELINETTKFNDISSNLSPGQKIKLAVKVKD